MSVGEGFSLTPETLQGIREEFFPDELCKQIPDGVAPPVGVIMGSDSDLGIMRHTTDALDVFGVDYETRVISAHRTPNLMAFYGLTAARRGMKVIIPGAGGSAHLQGMTASKTRLPILGVAINEKNKPMQAAVASQVEMPKGIPLAYMGENEAGAFNAGLEAVRILALNDPELAKKYEEYGHDLAAEVMEKSSKLWRLGPSAYLFVKSDGEKDQGLTKINHGKTKDIYEIPRTSEVLVVSRDDITAGDGEKKDVMEGKGKTSTQTTSNCFELLTNVGIPNHFKGRESNRIFRADNVTMLPIELVARRLAYGSYLKRNPDTGEGERFGELVFEAFSKEDPLNDPILEYDFITDVVRRYNPKEPGGQDSLIDETPLDESPFALSADEYTQLEDYTLRTFEALETAWGEQDVTLVDLKIECGYTKVGSLVVADVIDNDSWRIWPGGNPANMKDKQQFRDGKPAAELADDYAWVANATNSFVA